MRKARDLTGQTFGRLTVLKQAGHYVEPSGQQKLLYLCRCSCGNTVTVRANNLRAGRTKSCGCLKCERGVQLGLSKRNRKTNRYEFEGEVGKCYFSNEDSYFLFDTEDYGKIKGYTWYRVGDRVEAYYCVSESRIYKAHVARLVMNCPEDLIVQHKNNDLLDNRKCNLQICSRAQLSRQMLTPKNNTTGYKGIQRSQQLKDGSYHYKALIYVNGKTHYLGTYKTFEEAYKVRREAEQKYFGITASDSAKEGDNQ